MPYLQRAHMADHAIFAVVRGVFHENNSHYAWSPDPSFSLSFLFLRGLARKTTYWSSMCSLTRVLNCHCMTGNGRQQALYCAYTFLVCFTAVQSRMLNQCRYCAQGTITFPCGCARGTNLVLSQHAHNCIRPFAIAIIAISVYACNDRGFLAYNYTVGAGFLSAPRN